MSYNDFVKEFNNGIVGSTVFFYGAEDFLINWATELVVTKYVDEELRHIDVQRLNGDVVSVNDIMSAARTYSMFSKKRVIIVDNFKMIFTAGESTKLTDEQKEFLKFIENPSDSSLVVFIVSAKNSENIKAFGKKLMKACGNCYEFSRLDKATIKPFITKRIHRAGNMIGQRELDYLINMSGYFNKESEYTLENFEQDLAKLNNATQDGRISASLIDNLLVGDEDKFVFNLIDAINDGNKKKAMEMISAISVEKEEENMRMLLGHITKQFEIMYDAAELSTKGYSVAKMAKLTGVHEYRFKKAYIAARKFGRAKVKELLEKLYTIDINIKKGIYDIYLAIELFVYDV